ncbi:MAG: hypothetical protein AB8G26_00290 [Ilumatobacter sp.]
MRQGRTATGVAALAVVAVAGCSSADADPDITVASEPPPEPEREVVLDQDDSSFTETPTTTMVAPRVDGPLAEVCPSTIVVQTTDRLSVQIGSLVALLGDQPAIGDGTISGPVTRADGTVEEVTLELRIGGPSSGFRDALTVAASDETITLMHTSTAEMVRRHAEFPTVAVAALTESSRQSVLVDPATYPSAESIADVEELGIEVRHFTASPVYEFLGATGALSPDQLVGGFDGEPAGFVAAQGAIAQQGDILLDPAIFEALPQWGRPIEALPVSEAGWADHDDVIAVRADELDELAPCMNRLIPVIQRAIISYAEAPGDANVALAAARAAFDPLSRVTVEVLDDAEVRAGELGVVGNGDDSTIGDLDLDRLDPFLDELAGALGVDAVAVDVLATNEFVDPTIGR